MISILTICISGLLKAQHLLWLLLGINQGYWPLNLDSGACDWRVATVEKSAMCEAACNRAVSVEMVDRLYRSSVLSCGLAAAAVAATPAGYPGRLREGGDALALRR